MPAWQLLARMPDRSIGGILTGWTLQLTLRLNEVGTWALAIPAEQCPTGWPTPGCGLIALRDGTVVASGMWDDENYAWTANPDQDATGPGTYSLTGDTDLGRLAYRICYPTPSAVWSAQTSPYWRYPFDGSTSTAEDVMRVTVNYQAGSLATTQRRVPGVRLGAATGAGTQVRIQERFTPLLDALRKVAAAGGRLIFDVRDNLDTGYDFTVRAPADLTGTARFGIDMGNVDNLTARRSAPTVTDALVAGGGELVNRYLAEFHDDTADTAWGRRELFVDQRQVETTTATPEDEAKMLDEFAKAADEAFAAGGEQTGVAATIRDTPTVAWGRDYNLGDLVAIQTPAGPVTDLIRQTAITVDATGVEDITSTIGSTDNTDGDPLETTVRRLLARVNQLERAL